MKQMAKNKEVKKDKNGIPSMFMDWWRSTKPPKGAFILSCILVTIAQATWVIIPIFAAKVITCLTVSNYYGAVINLIIAFCFLLLRNSMYIGSYANRKNIFNPPYMRISDLLTKKMHKTANSSFNIISKEKIINRIHSDVYNMADFGNILTDIFGISMRVLITLVTVLVINPLIGVVVIVINIINFFILDSITKKRQVCVRKIKSMQDIQFSNFAEIIDSRKDVTNLGVQKKLEKKYTNTIEEHLKYEHQRRQYQSAQDNIFYMYWNFLVLIITIFFVWLLYKGSLNLELYLILVPYLISGIEICNAVYAYLPSLKNASVYTNRVNEVLNLSERHRKPYGKTTKMEVLEYIDFKNVNFEATDENPKLTDVSFSIKSKEVSLIYGPIQSGKRTIFHLLFRSIYPKTGRIYVDGLQYRHISKSGFKKLFTYVTANPFMLGGTIMNNLKIVGKNKENILKVCNDIEIYDKILKLPKGFNTSVVDVPRNLIYFIGMARALLANTDVIALYETPNTFDESEIKKLKGIINKYKNHKTFLIFTATDKFFDVSNKIIEMEAGKVKGIYYNE